MKPNVKKAHYSFHWHAVYFIHSGCHYRHAVNFLNLRLFHAYAIDTAALPPPPPLYTHASLFYFIIELSIYILPMSAYWCLTRLRRRSRRTRAYRISLRKMSFPAAKIPLKASKWGSGRRHYIRYRDDIDSRFIFFIDRPGLYKMMLFDIWYFSRATVTTIIY